VKSEIVFKIPAWTNVETAYIAGIIDGEGCIGIYYRNHRGYHIQLSITNTNKNLISWLKKKLHANAVKSLTDRRPKNKQSFSIIVDRMRAYEILQRVIPYLKIKTKQARLAIKFKEWQNSHKTGRGSSGHVAYSNEEILICDAFVLQSRILNKKGV
jgi:hypothetical protein